MTIPAGQTSALIPLDVIDNLTQEDTENVTVKLVTVPGTNGVAGDQDITIDGSADSATIAIVDNDLPTFTVLNTTANESEGTITFTIELSQPIDVPVDVFLNLSDGTATGAADPLDTNVSNQDFDNNDGGTVGTTGTVNFPADGGGTPSAPGTDLIRTITIDINDDIFVELDEIFTAQLIIDGGSTPTTLADGRDVVILDNQDPDEAYGQALIVDNDTATFTITGLGEGGDPTVDEGTNASPYDNNSPLTTVSFEITSSNPIDANVPLTVSFGGGTASGANFSVDGLPGSLQINQTTDVPFGVDFDNGNQTVTFLAGSTSQVVHVGVVQDQIVEGGASSTLPSFGVETFVASIEASDAALGDRAHDDSDDSTATIHDRDADDATLDDGDEEDRGSDNDQAVITVVATDDEAAEPTDLPLFNNGVWTITQSNPSSTTTVVRFQLSGDAEVGVNAASDADFYLTAFVSGTSTPVTLVNLGSGEFTVEIPASTVGNEITAVDIVLNVIDDDVTGDADDGDGLLEDDEMATLSLVEVVSGDPEVRLSDELQSDTIQIDDDDEGLVSVKSDEALGGDSEAAETDPEGGNDGRFVFFLRDNAGDLTVSDTATVITFQVTLPTGSDVDTDPDNDQANPLNDFVFSSSQTLTFDPATGIGTIEIPAETSTAELNVEVLNDSLAELAEQVTITITDSISNPMGNADIDVDTTMDTANVEIEDDGDGLTVNAEFGRNGQEPGTDMDETVQFVITLRDAFGNLVTVPSGSTGGGGVEVNFTITPDASLGDAAETSDFTVPSFTTVIAEGDSSVLVDIDVVDDFLVENSEGLKITITAISTTSGPLTTLAGETITIGDSMETAEIIDNDVAPAVAAVYVNGTDWTALFRDRVDGTEDGSTYGYELTNRTGEINVPWINVDQIIVEFDAPIDSSSIDATDFDISGVLGFGGGATPGILSATAGPGNSVILTLDGYLEPANVTLDINGTGLQTSGVNGTDSSISFVALPGDTNSDNTVSPADIDSTVDRQFAFILPGDFSFGDYEFSSDLNGDGTISPADIDAATDRQFDFVIPSGGGSSFAAASVRQADFLTPGGDNAKGSSLGKEFASTSKSSYDVSDSSQLSGAVELQEKQQDSRFDSVSESDVDDVNDVDDVFSQGDFDFLSI